MARQVLKFGGTSVRDIDHIKHAATIIARAASQGDQVVTVVSAMGHTTDNLISMADAITSDANDREMDMLLATGEQVSIALLTMAVQQLGVKARSFTGAQAGIVTEPVYQHARIKSIQTANLDEALNEGYVAIVAGFQGVSEQGELCTLGRGGSDTTAVALAAALKAECCDIYSDVNGVYTADPRVFPYARKLSVISFEEMLEMAAAGAQVLNARSVELAMNNRVPVRLRSTFEPEDLGTLVTHKHASPDYVVCGIASDTNRVAFNLRLPRRGRKANNKAAVQYLEGVSAMFQALTELGITTDMVTLLGRDGDLGPELIFTVEKRSARKVEHVIEELSAELGYPEVRADGDIARISVIGNGLSCRRGVVAAIFDILCSASIPVQMLTTGDIRVTALVPAKYKDAAVQRIHERFCIYPPADGRVIPESRVA
ncbi:MAG TPA: aspartate kinase [Candidatus Obscuribacterales bacterium]